MTKSLSRATVLAPIMQALVRSEDILGKDLKWTHISEIQQEFLQRFFSKRKELSAFSDYELKSWASFNYKELNSILQKENFTFRFSKFDRLEFGLLSILDVMVEWVKKGKRSKIFYKNGRYPAVEMDTKGFTVPFLVFHSKHHNQPIVRLSTRMADAVYMTIADCPNEGFGLVDRIEEIRTSLSKKPIHFDAVRFPMVDLNLESELSWLNGLSANGHANGSAYSVVRAFQQTKFAMNELGSRVKSAVGMVTFGASIGDDPEPEVLIINKPFFLWMQRPGISFPTFYAYIDQEHWKNPYDLKEI